jgi:hypothetical protein
VPAKPIIGPICALLLTKLLRNLKEDVFSNNTSRTIQFAGASRFSVFAAAQPHTYEMLPSIWKRKMIKMQMVL